MASGITPISQKREFRQITLSPPHTIHDSESVLASDYELRAVSIGPPHSQPGTMPLMVPARPWEEPQPLGGRNSINTFDFYSTLPLEDFEHPFRIAGQCLWLICQHCRNVVLEMGSCSNFRAPYRGWYLIPCYYVQSSKNWWTSQGVIPFSPLNITHSIPALRLSGYLHLSLCAMGSFGCLVKPMDSFPEYCFKMYKIKCWGLQRQSSTSKCNYLNNKKIK